MFELSVALKYLIPRRKQLSVSLIALMSVTVISLVVWLVLVFLSVTEGIERGWIAKLTTLNAPLRITPTTHYYDSYYYKIDGISASSDYKTKNIAQKQQALGSNPYNPEEDGELSPHFPLPDLATDGDLKDPVKHLFSSLNQLREKHPDLVFQDFELSGALLRLQLLRPGALPRAEDHQSYLTQVSYLATFPDRCPNLASLLIPPSKEDVNHLRYLANHTTEYSRQDAPSLTLKTTPEKASSRLQTLLSSRNDTQPLLRVNEELETSILLAKSYQDSGVLVGDRGYLSYSGATASSVQEHRLPIFVAGFYDPGILSVGNKCILVPPFVTQTINASNSSFNIDKTQSNGVLVWFEDIHKAEKIRQELVTLLKSSGVDAHWKVTPFKEYEFAKDLMQQFQSDKYLFTLVGVIILLVACCNIISLLTLLVNDKKKEIGILQTMGASRKSIALIFGTCGIAMGVLSSLIGTTAAVLTLHHIDSLVQLLSFIQGQDAFNTVFFGKSLPNELSHSALFFILVATPLLSLIAGFIPALQACRLSPSEILRSE